MKFTLDRTDEAKKQLAALEADKGQHKTLKAVKKSLGRLQLNPKHPSLNSHPLNGLFCPHKDTLWEAYAQNNTPNAWRILYCYPPNKRGYILIIQIIPHL